MIRRGLRQPAFKRNLILDQGAEHVQHGGHGDGARRVEVVRQLPADAGEIDARAAPLGIDRDAARESLRPLSSAQGEFSVVQRRDHTTHAFLRVVLHVAHVARDGLSSRTAPPSSFELLHALFVGGDLRAQIGQVLRRIARRMRPGPQQFEQRLPRAVCPSSSSLKLSISTPFLGDAGRERRHRARRDAADVGMMAARGDEETRGTRSPEIPE